MIRPALAVALAALLLMPAVAVGAPDTVVDFEGQPAGTLIDDEYSGAGVLFGVAQDFGFPAPAQSCPRAHAFAGGITGTSIDIGCTGGKEFSQRAFGTAIEFAAERRAVRFKLSQRAMDGDLNAVVAAYSAGGGLLEQRTVALARGAVVDVAFTRPSSQIVGISISGALSLSAHPTVLLDDLAATVDDSPPPPKFALALSTPSIEVVEGSTGEAAVSVRRYNGSTGPVNLSVGALPPGIRAAELTPNPVTGRTPSTLRVTLDSPLSGQRQLPVTAAGGGSAGTAAGAQLVQTVRAVPAVQFATGGRSAISLVPGCGPQTVDDGFTVRGGYTRSVFVSTGGATGGLKADVAPRGFGSTGDGFYPLKLTLDPGSADGGGQFDLTVSPFSATDVSLRMDWRTDRLRVERSEPMSVRRPLRPGGSTIGVIGRFPSGCAVTFQDGAGQTWPARRREGVDVDGRPRDRVVLDLPTTAVSGPLRVLSPTGVELARTAPIDVTDFRNTFALSGANSGPGAGAPDYTWGEFERTFGTDDTDACFIACIRDPVALAHYIRYRDAIRAYRGLCFGWSVMALRFRGYTGISEPLAAFSPTARRAFQIAPLTDGTAIKRELVRWQVAQHDKKNQELRAAQRDLPAADERRQITETINRAGGALLTISQGDAGHAVVAYAAEPTTIGGLRLSIYDPNIPHDPAEETSADARKSNLERSAIILDADGSWSGSSLGWAGPNSTLRVLPLLPPENAKLPFSFSVASITSSGPGPTASVTSITAGGKEALAADGTGRPGSGVDVEPDPTGVAAQPNYQLTPGREYVMTVRGNRAGRYDNGLLGRGAAATVRGAATVAGQEDRLRVRPGTAHLNFTTGAARAPVTYELADEAGKATRTALVQTTATKGAADEAELGGGTLRLKHDGASATARITLGSVGEGLPGSVVTAPLKLGRGERLELRPRSWRSLADGVRLTARNASGRVLRRGEVRLVTTKAVAIAGLRARRRGTKVTVTGRITKRGSAPVLVAAAELVRRGRVVRRRSGTLRGAAVKAGRFSVPIAVGRLPRGVRLRVTTTLLDEAAGLATVRRTVAVRGTR